MTDHIIFSREQDALLLLDQRKLPVVRETFVVKSVEDVIYALQTMVVRGAPAIGVTAAYGCYLAAREVEREGVDADWRERLEAKLTAIENARPTAVNLAWAVKALRGVWQANPRADLFEVARMFLGAAEAMHAEDVEINKAIGRHGAELLKDGDRVMTHCNAGALATAGHGTALGVIYSAIEAGKKISVIANETRPFLQGARLTAYELQCAGAEVQVACDNAAALLMQKGLVNAVVVGADRVAANGDAANKIGTFGVAIIAARFGVPFYVAAPLSTIDLETPTGADIPIEERPAREVTHVGETRIVPENVEVYNFAFDVTPAELIAGIVTEAGVLRAPYGESIQDAKAGRKAKSGG